MISRKILILALTLALIHPASALTLSEVQEAINESNASWTAAYSGNHVMVDMNTTGLQGIASRDFYWDGIERPDYYSLRDEGLTTPVKRQGACGSCWAFAAVAAVESTILKEHGIAVDLSEQNMVDNCMWGGCKGGSPYNAMFYMYNHGIDIESAYPYEAAYRECRLTDNWTDRGWIVDYLWQPKIYELYDQNKSKTIQQGIMEFGGATVCIDTREDFVYYAGGIYEPLVGRDLNHAVELVGWNWTGDPDTSYWIIKNSWGTYWGEDGYGKIKWNAGLNYYNMLFANQTHRIKTPFEVYDRNNNSVIDKCEAVEAIKDYFDGKISYADVTEVLTAYNFPPCQKYDITEPFGEITKDEAVNALNDYYNECLKKDDMVAVLDCYFFGGGNS